MQNGRFGQKRLVTKNIWATPGMLITYNVMCTNKKKNGFFTAVPSQFSFCCNSQLFCATIKSVHKMNLATNDKINEIIPNLKKNTLHKKNTLLDDDDTNFRETLAYGWADTCYIKTLLLSMLSMPHNKEVTPPCLSL